MKTVSMKFLVCAIALVFAGIPTVASADHTWGSYHWARTSISFILKLGNNLSGAWLNDTAANGENHLNTTSADWSVSSVLDTEVVPGGTTSDPKKCRPTTGRVEVCSASYGGAWLGLAQIWVSGSHIYQATSKVNDFYFNKAKYNTPAWRNLVMCQEVGHTFGLDHQDVDFNNANLGTCMDYTRDPSSNQHPNAHDYEQLETIYAHLDSTTTVAQASASAAEMPRAMAEYDYAERTQWGKLIRSSKNGLKEVYLLDFGRGYKIFTFVTWAEGQGRGR